MDNTITMERQSMDIFCPSCSEFKRLFGTEALVALCSLLLFHNPLPPNYLSFYSFVLTPELCFFKAGVNINRREI